MPSTGFQSLRFGPFDLSRDQRELRREGAVLPLGGRALDLLYYLVERPGEVITKKELIDHVWSGVVVEEGSLRVHIAAIRKALGDGKFGNRYIANVQGRGYSFVGYAAGPDVRKTNNPNRQYEGILPARPRRMVGRDLILGDVQRSLREERFVTLLGPGGIGKTTIAVTAGHALADEFGGEVYFVDLGSLADPEHVVRAIGTSLGLVLKSNDASVELVDLVRSRRLLIILDSCEHVIKAVAPVAEQLCQEAAQVYLLATSREPMRVEGEHCFHVLPLDFPPADAEHTAEAVLRYPAVQLFVERVTARGASFLLSDREAPFVADMCRRLDGLPLAIELAAGPVAALGVKSTVARLVSRLSLLKLGHRTTISRQQTLKATLDWSFDLLSDMERIVFRRLGCFVGYFALESARIVVVEENSADVEVLDAIAGLVEKSLITKRLDDGELQYRLLDTTRAYALEKLAEYAESAVIFQRHAEYFASHLESQKDLLATWPRARRAASYSRQLGNVRAALEWSFGPQGNNEIATMLAVAATPLFIELSLLIECQSWLEQAIACLGDRHRGTVREMEICTSLPLGLMYSEEGRLPVRAAFSRALNVASGQGDLACELRLLSKLFGYSYWTIDIDEALELAARGKAVALKTQDSNDMAIAECMLGSANHLVGNHRVAQTHFESGLLYAASGSRFRTGQNLFPYPSFSAVGIARTFLYQGMLDRALVHAKRAMELAEEADRPAALCGSLVMVLPVFLSMTECAEAENDIAQLGDVSARYSLLPYRAAALGFKGRWLLLQGNFSDAILLLKRALEELRAQHQEMLRMEFVCDLAAGLIAVEQHEEALGLIVSALDDQQRTRKFLHMPALLRMKGLALSARSAEGYLEAETSLVSSIEWARRQSANLIEVEAATDLAELLLSHKRAPDAHKYMSAALEGASAGIASPVHERARRVFDRLQSGA